MNNVTNTFTIMTQPYYDSCTQNYENILVVNVPPNGPLRKLTRRIKPNYGYGYGNGYGNAYRFNNNNNINGCSMCGVLALTSLCNDSKNGFMTPNNYPDLLSWMMSNGYQIETQLTNMMNASEVKVNGMNKIVCVATYYDPTTSPPPNITYMR